MRHLMLDCRETDGPESEETVGLSRTSKRDFTSLEDFIVHSGYIDLDLFRDIDSPRKRESITAERLTQFITSFRESYSTKEIPLPELGGFVYANDWDYKDYAYETEAFYVRVVWETTS